MSIATRIKDGVRPVVLVHGDATALVERTVKLLVAWGRERCGPPEFNLESWSATDARAESALLSARTPPMMAPLRVVVLREQRAANIAAVVVPAVEAHVLKRPQEARRWPDRAATARRSADESPV